jgi:hypothetical protein
LLEVLHELIRTTVGSNYPRNPVIVGDVGETQCVFLAGLGGRFLGAGKLTVARMRKKAVSAVQGKKAHAAEREAHQPR